MTNIAETLINLAALSPEFSQRLKQLINRKVLEERPVPPGVTNGRDTATGVKVACPYPLFEPLPPLIFGLFTRGNLAVASLLLVPLVVTICIAQWLDWRFTSALFVVICYVLPALYVVLPGTTTLGFDSFRSSTGSILRYLGVVAVIGIAYLSTHISADIIINPLPHGLPTIGESVVANVILAIAFLIVGASIAAGLRRVTPETKLESLDVSSMAVRARPLTEIEAWSARSLRRAQRSSAIQIVMTCANATILFAVLAWSGFMVQTGRLQYGVALGSTSLGGMVLTAWKWQPIEQMRETHRLTQALDALNMAFKTRLAGMKAIKDPVARAEAEWKAMTEYLVEMDAITKRMDAKSPVTDRAAVGGMGKAKPVAAALAGAEAPAVEPANQAPAAEVAAKSPVTPSDNG